MGVYIKGMEMPKRCDICPFDNGEHCLAYPPSATMIYDIKDGIPDWCPLVEITKHGRLIDADAFDERVRVAGGMSEEELTEDFKDGVQTVLYMLSKQPTIIEAEGSEEEE